MVGTAVDFLMENLKRLMSSDIWLILGERDQIESLAKELVSLRDILKDLEKESYKHAKVKNLEAQLRDVALEADDTIDSLVVSTIKQRKRTMARKFFCVFYPYHRLLRNIRKEIKSITKDLKEIHHEKLYDVDVSQVGMSSPSIGSSSRVIAPNTEEEVVGFDHEAEKIMECLTGLPKQLEIISIVGMAGLGKTTLARKLYNDPLVVYHFYVRGWSYVSQTYRKRDMLLEILSSVVESKDEIYQMSDERLGEELYRRLKGKRYFIVMDDIWNVQAWDDLKRSFPNDNNGSRILFTSRLADVVLHAKPHKPPYFLRFLTPNESWDLLQRKVFRRESCPPELMETGKQLAEKCQGLPIAIVVVAGLLAKTDKTVDWWKQVAESVSSYIVSDPSHCMDTLALSYNHLPHHLKSCFLYFAAFSRDHEIPVWKLIWSWVAEGFIQKVEQKSLEDVAEEYLMDLIDRSLVLIAKERSTGGIKACRVHDLLHDLCLRKAKEENFLQHIYGGQDHFSSSSVPSTNKHLCLDTHSCFFGLFCDLCLRKAKEEKFLQRILEYKKRRLCIHSSSSSFAASSYSSSHAVANKQHCLCIYSSVLHCFSSEPSAPHIRSILWFATAQCPLPNRNIMSFNYRVFKLLRILDLSAITIHVFLPQILDLVHLRYLALRGKGLSLPGSISNLWNLETLIISEGMGMDIPLDICRVRNLRHLRISGENHLGYLGYGGRMYNLQTISQLSPSSYFMNQIPNVRKLGFCGKIIRDGQITFPNVDSLNHLEALKLLNRTPYDFPLFACGCNLQNVKFSPSLKRLTLSLTYIDWKEMSTIALLPNLEALKLEYQACYGTQWETSDGGFLRLKYLRFYYMNIEQWNSYSTHFPSLQHLVLHKCEKLKEIPLELGNIPTLQTIDVSWCSHSTVTSARQIQEEQQRNGNDFLRISINPPDWELTSFT